jgi:RNA polymerase sigma factor (sigma-70 family)
MARRLSRSLSDAEDATQEIFLQLWQQAQRFDDSLGSERAFVAMIARRRLIDGLRKAAAEPQMSSCEAALESVAWEASDNTPQTCHEAEQAWRALQELRPQYRRVLELGLLHGLTQLEIAQRLSMPLGTVKTFTRRGLLIIRECLRAETPASPSRSRSSWAATLTSKPNHLVRPPIVGVSTLACPEPLCRV